MGRSSLVFYRSFYEAICELEPSMQAEVYTAIFEYSLNYKEIELKGLSKTIFTLIQPQLDANLKKYENGSKGGRPPKTEPKPNQEKTKEKPNENQTETKEEPRGNQTETETEPKQNQEGSKSKANVNVNVNDNVNVFKEVVSLWNITCCPPLSKVEKITKSRKDKMRIRLAEMAGDIETVKTIFEKVKNSGFMKGDNVRGWKVTFDWIFENDKNWVKILEGNYDGSNKSDNGQKTAKQSSTMEDYAAKDYESRF